MYNELTSGIVSFTVLSEPKTDKEWQDHVKGLVKAELAKRNINYVQLAGLLNEAYGITESPQNLSNKIARGKFSAVFMVQVFEVIGCQELKIP